MVCSGVASVIRAEAAIVSSDAEPHLTSRFQTMLPWPAVRCRLTNAELPVAPALAACAASAGDQGRSAAEGFQWRGRPKTKRRRFSAR